MKELDFIPGHGLIAVRHIEERARESGIIVSAVQKAKYPAKGEILRAGEDLKDETTIGDVVLYDMAVIEGLSYGGEVFDLVLIQNVLGTFPQPKE